MSTDNDNENELNEPSASYNTRSIRIFHSFDDARDQELEAIINQSPIERIRETVALILRVYGVTQEELNKRPRNNHITIHHSS